MTTRKAYHAPRLAIHGDVERLTQSSSGGIGATATTVAVTAYYTMQRLQESHAHGSPKNSRMHPACFS